MRAREESFHFALKNQIAKYNQVNFQRKNFIAKIGNEGAGVVFHVCL